MSLDSVRRTFEEFGRDDPLYAVLSHKDRKHNQWDPAEFFETGRKEIAGVLDYLRDLGLTVQRGRALDFGCGVGRLSQALAEHFERVTGVDIAESMVRLARGFNKHGNRVEYVVNTIDRLTFLESASIDFVYSNITLQHIPPEPALNYIREFFRVLGPGGVAVFQVPDGKAYEPASFGQGLYNLRRRHLKRLWKTIRGKPPVEMHYIPFERVQAIIQESGGRLVHHVGVGQRRNFRYCAAKT